jgi:AbrB family looped-hinge helix DNA binding protein
MPILSSKRQITLPKELCDRLSVQPGDDLLILEYRGQITILKRTKDRARGLLKDVRGIPGMTDDESRDSALAERHAGRRRKRRAA